VSQCLRFAKITIMAVQTWLQKKERRKEKKKKEIF
jgi:hypothetical protein